MAEREPTYRDALRDALVVVAIALVASLSGLANQFALDDVPLIEANARVHSLGRLAEILGSPYWPPPFQEDLWRPITSTLMAIEYQLGGGGPLIFRIASYLLYAACAVAVLRLAADFLPRRYALGVAAIFAAHPVHVEAVALGVNQAEMIVGLAVVAAVRRYVACRRNGWLGTKDWAVLAALYAGAALTKENGFILPGILISAEWFLFDDERPAVRFSKLAPGFAALVLVGIGLAGVRAIVLSGHIAGATPAEAFVGLGMGERALTMLRVVPVYVRLFAWPAHLQVDYGPDEVSPSTAFGWEEAAGLALLGGAIAVVLATSRRAHVVAFGLAWCAIGLLPVSNVLVPTGIVLAERTLFLSSVGAVLGGGALVHAFVAVRPATARPIAFACGLLALVGAAASARRHTAWRSSAHLWQVTAEDAPRSAQVWRVKLDAIRQASRRYRPAIAAAQVRWPIRNEFASVLFALGEQRLAMVELGRSLAENRDQPGAALDLADLLVTNGLFEEAAALASDSTSPPRVSAALRGLAARVDSARRVTGSSRESRP